jgi:hypothetical protein
MGASNPPRRAERNQGPLRAPPSRRRAILVADSACLRRPADAARSESRSTSLQLI